MKMLGRVCFLILGSSLWGQETPDALLRTFRDDLGLHALLSDQVLTQSSLNRARELSLSGFLSHRDARGRGPGIQMAGEGLPPGVFGEVLGAGPSFASVWKAWLSSPIHREVLEDRVWTSWGWACSDQGGVTVWVARFWGP